ncbi:MAG TPA: chlorite dismutase family protein [Candidatus Bathyarchaeia archaeon]|nr:chlorite dismutase family protein [Candidatus Bathyarchaeia archaeon]
MSGSAHGGPSEIRVEVAERGANGQTSSRRLFMQLQVYGGCPEPKALAAALERSQIEAVLYADLGDPRGVGVLTFAEDPVFLATRVREVLAAEPFGSLSHKPALTMIGRSYASGFETDLEDWLLRRPRRTVLNPAWPWAVWYPLRRTGAFAKLSAQEQGSVLREHGTIGRAYGDADLAHDIRLACHGLDQHDNDFLIGLVGRELQPLSHLVQTMRRTAQTSEYMASLGPFFVGHVVWQAPAR